MSAAGSQSRRTEEASGAIQCELNRAAAIAAIATRARSVTRTRRARSRGRGQAANASRETENQLNPFCYAQSGIPFRPFLVGRVARVESVSDELRDITAHLPFSETVKEAAGAHVKP